MLFLINNRNTYFYSFLTHPYQATDLTKLLSVAVTAGNTSVLPQNRGWAPPNKHTTFGAFARAIEAVSNSSNPLNETKILTQGLELHKAETKALLKGQSNLVTYVSSVNFSPRPTSALSF